MKKIIIFVLLLTIICGGVYIYLNENGHTYNSIVNTRNTYDLDVTCNNLTNILVSSTVDVNVQNNSQRTHKNILVKITAYDKNGNIIKEKETQFLRDLNGFSSFSKIITLPSRTKSCNCILLNSTPE